MIEESERKPEVLSKVIDFCHQTVAEDREVYSYLRNSRKLTDDTIAKFKLGAFPKNPLILTKWLKGIDAWDLVLAGVLQHQDGKNYSKFSYNRVIIPIYDAYGRPIAITGRTLLDKDECKSLRVNKYDGTKFSKGSCLFGLNVVKKDIRKNNAVLVVEGNFDVISAYQSGIKGVVGAGGSWLTKKQIRILSRYTNRIFLCLDNDEAGRMATERTLARPPPKGVSLYKKDLSEKYKDLDEYLQTNMS